MIEEITNKELLKKIKDGIAEYSIFIFAVVGYGDLETYTKMTDMWAYTIGHKEINRPDMLIYLGPYDGEDLDNKAKATAVKEGSRLLNHLCETWDKTPLKVGDLAADRSGRTYKAVSMDKAGHHSEAKRDYAIQASNYYGSYDYELIILEPIGHMDDNEEEE